VVGVVCRMKDTSRIVDTREEDLAIIVGNQNGVLVKRFFFWSNNDLDLKKAGRNLHRSQGHVFYHRRSQKFWLGEA